MRAKILNELIIQTILSVVVGLIVAITAHYFIEGARYFLSFVSKFQQPELNVGEASISLTPVIAMLIGAILIIVVRRLIGVTKWSGPADSIYALQQSKVGVDVKVGLGSTLAAFISASAGASVGQYGPLVHFGATLSTILTKLFKNIVKKDVGIACGVAAAISSGFNAPIGGIIFAHEALLRRFSVSAVAPISVASIVAAATNSFFFDSSVAFNVSVTDLALGAVVPLVILFAPVCTFASILYMSCLRSFQRFAASGKVTFNKLILSTAVTVGLIGIWVPEIMGLGSPEIDAMIAGQFSITESLLVLVLKIVITAACIGFGFFGGVFGPALFIGAAVGSLLTGILVQWGLPSDYYSVLSVATMAAVGASVIGAPITVVLIVIELTQSYQYGLMALLSVTMSSKLTYQLFGLSFFDRQLLDRGIDMTRGREYIHLSQTYVREIEGSDYLVFQPQTSQTEAISKLKEARMSEAYVAEGTNNFLGKFSLLDITDTEEPVSSVMDRNPVFLEPENSLTESLEVAADFVGESIPIVEDGKIIGALTEGDLFTQVLAIQERLRAE